jgi:membrane fusion protein (multidrug efflux system)
MEDVKDKIATLETSVAALDSAQAVAKRAKADLDRAVPLAKNGAVSSEELDRRTQVVAVADAQVKEALQGVYQIRASLGLDKDPGNGNLASVPDNLVEMYSSVRQAQFELMQAAAQLGVIYPFERSPKQMLDDFKKRDPDGNIDNIYAKILKEAPAVIQAQAKVAQANKDLDLAKLNLKYCNVYAEIDGVVTRRNVNPGNNVVAGQEIMAIRSLKEIWIDANFKETELAALRIGQPVDLRLDMYGKKKEFKGRITGFTMGTGSTLALLPAQNATGNFVKVVQRLPVRIDVDNYDPEKDPLFIGLSVEPVVYINETPTGPDAGKLLQPYITPTAPTTSPTTQIAEGGK